MNRNNISLIRSLLEHDLSGHSIIIENHSDVSTIGKSGTILSESKQMLIIQELSKEIGITTMISKKDGLFTFLQGDLKLTDDGIRGGDSIPLQFVGSVMRPELAKRFPHLGGASILKISDEYLPLVPEILKLQIAVSFAMKD